MNIRKIMFIPYIYPLFTQNLDEKSYISATTEAVKHLHAVVLLSAEQRGRPIRLRDAWFIVTSITSRDSITLRSNGFLQGFSVNTVII